MDQLVAVLLWNQAPHSLPAGAPTLPAVLGARVRLCGLHVHRRPIGMRLRCFTGTFHDCGGLRSLLVRTGPEREPGENIYVYVSGAGRWARAGGAESRSWSQSAFAIFWGVSLLLGLVLRSRSHFCSFGCHVTVLQFSKSTKCNHLYYFITIIGKHLHFWRNNILSEYISVYENYIVSSIAQVCHLISELLWKCILITIRMIK